MCSKNPRQYHVTGTNMCEWEQVTSHASIAYVPNTVHPFLTPIISYKNKCSQRLEM
jgi:hypothetical protein